MAGHQLWAHSQSLTSKTHQVSQVVQGVEDLVVLGEADTHGCSSLADKPQSDSLRSCKEEEKQALLFDLSPLFSLYVNFELLTFENITF